MTWIRLGSLVMFLGIALGAFGAHALKGLLTHETKSVYETAVFYHLIHGLAILLVGWIGSLKPGNSLLFYTGLLFISGIILFSGSLYLLAITGIKKWGLVTPFGGLAFLGGWLLLILAAR